MEKILTQEEIDALFLAARQKAAPAASTAPTWTPCDFRRVGQITSEQVHAVSSQHESFARSLTSSLGAYFRTALEVNLVSVEQLAYRDLLGRLPDLSYISSIRVSSGATGLMQLDLSLAFAAVDLLLGGDGRQQPNARELTTVEADILEVVATMVTRELTAAWKGLGLVLELGSLQKPGQAQRMLAGGERVLAMSFEMKLAEARGNLNLAFPATVANAIFRHTGQDESAAQFSRADEASRERLRQRALRCRFRLELALPPLRVEAEALIGLRPDSVLMLPRPIHRPARLEIRGVPLFDALPVASEGTRAAHLQCARPVQEGES